jgi:deferrochelatase/peroxidase EfeB
LYIVRMMCRIVLGSAFPKSLSTTLTCSFGDQDQKPNELTRTKTTKNKTQRLRRSTKVDVEVWTNAKRKERLTLRGIVQSRQSENASEIVRRKIGWTEREPWLAKCFGRNM